MQKRNVKNANALFSRKMRSSPTRRLAGSLSYSNIWLWALALIKNQRLHAYTLNEKIEQKFGFLPGRIMAYVVLYKLEQEGLLASKVSKRRKYYVLSAKGKKELRAAKELMQDAAREL